MSYKLEFGTIVWYHLTYGSGTPRKGNGQYSVFQLRVYTVQPSSQYNQGRSSSVMDAKERFQIFPSTSCSFWKCCETFGSRCFKIGKLILPSICFQAILSPLDRSCLSYEIFKSIESSKLNKNFGMGKIRKTERLTMFQIHNRKFFDKLQTIGKIWHLCSTFNKFFFCRINSPDLPQTRSMLKCIHIAI